LARKIADARREVSRRHGRSPTVPELAEYLEISEEDVLDGLQTNEAYDTVSLDAPRVGDEETENRIEALGSQDERLDLVDDQATVFAAAQHLPERERRILYLRFGEDLTQAEIARRIGVSQMQVSRLLRKSVQRLRDLTQERPQPAPRKSPRAPAPQPGS
jgi:RNA polymerase sigma-B factor